MHPALNIVTFGLLSLHLQRKEVKRAEKRAKAEYAEHCVEIERKYQAAQEALRAEELRRRDAAQKAKEQAQQAKEQAEDLEFSKDPLAYIASHFFMLNTIMQEGCYITTFDFGYIGSIDQRITSAALFDDFGDFWRSNATRSRALCVKMDECLTNEIWDQGTAWGYFM